MSRDIRRHHEQRMKNRAKFVAGAIFGYASGDTKHPEAYKSIVNNSNNLKQCSHEMCRNPRRSKLTSNQGRTRQEIKSELSFKDQLE